MAGSLSFDLRRRVLAAVVEGLSRRAAAERFAVSAASVSRWRALERVQGDARPRAWAETRSPIGLTPAGMTSLPPSVLSATAIDEVSAIRREEKGLVFGFGAIQRFFKRHVSTSEQNRASGGVRPSEPTA